MEKKPVGILTFHRGPNYGGFLQAWHLREAIRSLGHRATLINFQSRVHWNAERNRLAGWSRDHLRGFAHRYLKGRPFRSQVAALCDHGLLIDPARVDWRRFSTVVVGSDVIWDFAHPVHGNEPAYFGALQEQSDTRFVGYAASAGPSAAVSPAPSFVADGLRRFASIRVRDQSTAAMVTSVTGIEPEIVVDPTWLHPDPKAARKRSLEENYVLLYAPGASPARYPALKKFCVTHGLKLVSAASSCPQADIRLRSIGPFEWVELFRNASAVVTSTLHGLLYTIKYQKPLLFMSRGPSHLKSQTVIERCGLGAAAVPEEQPFTEELLERCLASGQGASIPVAWRERSLEALAVDLR
jgi:hypothetical protein